MVEDGVDTTGREPADLPADVTVTVVDRFDTHGAQRFVIPLGSGADHPNPFVAGDLSEDAADAAAGAMDQDGLPRLDLRRCDAASDRR